MRVILASRSPRRRELLQWIFPSFEAIPSGEPEDMKKPVPPEELVQFLARQKALGVASRLPEDCLVIGCDTIVVSPEEGVFGIPGSRKEAADMLNALSGRVHRVLTGVCLAGNGKRREFYEETKVEFYPLSPEEIEEYLKTGEPFDKAGAYGIQGRGGLLVKGIEGDFYNVVGLPVARLKREILQFIDE